MEVFLMQLPLLHYSRPEDSYWQSRIRKSMDKLDNSGQPESRSRLCQAWENLFKSCLNEEFFLHSSADNPIEHHLVVLSAMCSIAAHFFRKNEWDWFDFKVATTAALLHDICPIERVTKEIINRASSEERPALEFQRETSASLHMLTGARMAYDLLCQYKSQEPESYSFAEIKRISDLISIHDNPKLNLPLPDDNLIIALREADRLWMVTPAGIAADLHRKSQHGETIDFKNPTEYAKQVVRNLASLRQEALLYGRTPYDGSAGTFFRTTPGCQMLIQYLCYWQIACPEADID
jgi:hypothetical protein